MATLADRIELVEQGPAAAAVVSELHRRAFPADTGERWRQQDMAAALEQPGSVCLVANLAGRPAGYALARIIGEECELLSLGVVPEARRCGVAGRLLARLIEICRARNAARLFLEVREDNLPARAFYAANGFEQIGRRPEYYRSPTGRTQDAMTLAIQLGPVPK